MKRIDGKWVRETPEAPGPNRAFGGYYRSSDRLIDGRLLRGVPLQTTQDAVVAAVKLGYRVVDAQIDRGMRAAQRLRGAAERQGSGDPGQMLDAGERLASKALAAGLQWFENASAEPGSPVKRLLAAEYDMVGSILGLKRGDAGRKRRRNGDEDKGEKSAKGGKGSAKKSRAAAAPEDPGRARRPGDVRIVHDADSARRAVEVRLWRLDAADVATELRVVFYPLDSAQPATLEGHVSFEDARPVLRIATQDVQPGGRWRGAVCSDAGEQLGVIEIAL